MDKLVVYGRGITGNALAKYLSNIYDICIYSDKDKVKKDFKDILDGAIGIVRSPGVKNNAPLLCLAREQSIPVYEEIDITFQHYDFSRTKFILITGTNGKSTLVRWLESAFMECDISVIALGNIGTPISSLISAAKPYSYVILELSSYQLKNFRGIFFASSLILNISPDHLDWHDSYEDYVSSKLNIYKKSNRIYFDDIEHIYNYIYSKDFHSPILFSFVNKEAEFLKERYDLKSLPVVRQWLTGFTFLLSILCDELSQSNFKKVLSNIEQICRIEDHKDQYLGKVDDIDIVDDSKGTNILALKTAIANRKNSTLIVGGDFKGVLPKFTLSEKRAIRAILIFGVEKAVLFHLFLRETECTIALVSELSDMYDVVLLGLALAQSTGSSHLLFSPGGGSYGEYKNYIERGREFQRSLEQVKKVK